VSAGFLSRRLLLRRASQAIHYDLPAHEIFASNRIGAGRSGGFLENAALTAATFVSVEIVMVKENQNRGASSSGRG
jgi:hypothetical protein